MSKKHRPVPPPPVLSCTGVETHAHLNSKQYTDDLDDVLARAQAAGVSQFIQVFLHPAEYQEQKERFQQYANIWYILGIHPTEADRLCPATREDMRTLLQEEPRFRAIGEIGLDFYWKEQSREKQEAVFIEQLALAKACDLPVVIHSRDAHDETIAILLQEGFVDRPLLWHCFGGSARLALQLVEYGWHLSIPGPVTFPANAALREAVAAVPLERLMTETDCPYLSPVPYRGQRNEPAFLAYTIAAMAEARGMDADTLWRACGDNARRFFGLPFPG